MLGTSEFWIGVVVGVAAIYLWRMWQARQAASQ